MHYQYYEESIKNYNLLNYVSNNYIKAELVN